MGLGQWLANAGRPPQPDQAIIAETIRRMLAEEDGTRKAIRNHADADLRIAIKGPVDTGELAAEFG